MVWVTVALGVLMSILWLVYLLVARRLPNQPFPKWDMLFFVVFFVYAPSRELAGSTIQVLDYRRSLYRDLNILNRDKIYSVAAHNPKAVVIIGNSSELENEEKKRSFQLFRSGFLDVEIVTFDDLFLKIERLASLFNLVRKPNN